MTLGGRRMKWTHTKPDPAVSALESIWKKGPWRLEKFMNRSWSVWYAPGRGRGKPVHRTQLENDSPLTGSRATSNLVFVVFSNLPDAKRFVEEALAKEWKPVP